MDIQPAVEVLKRGGIIAYPTESVYGLGCDPFNEKAVMRLLGLKKRSVEKGLILIAADWEQVKSLVKPIKPYLLKRVLATWPGPVTWTFPAAHGLPQWIRGAHSTVAIRVTAHPIASELCRVFNQPLVSTSANIEGQPPVVKDEDIEKIFPEGIDGVVTGSLGGLAKPTEIRSALTGETLRAG